MSITKKFLLIVAVMAMTFSCKKNDAASKIDVDAVEVAKAQEETPNPEANIGGPDLPEAVPVRPADGKYAVMSFDKTSHDFGNINEGDVVNYTFKFVNTGAADLIISDAKGSCGCTIPEYPKEAIKVGETAKIKVKFNSANKPDKQRKTVTIHANTVSGKEMLSISADVKAK